MSTPGPQEPETRTVYVLNGTGTSRGNGLGVVADLPAAEAAFLVGESLAVLGSVPPSGYLGNGITISPYTGAAPTI